MVCAIVVARSALTATKIDTFSRRLPDPGRVYKNRIKAWVVSAGQPNNSHTSAHISYIEIADSKILGEMDARPATNPIRRRKSLMSACNKSRSSSKQLSSLLELHFSGVVTMQTYINQCIAHCSVHLPYCKTQQQLSTSHTHVSRSLRPGKKRRFSLLSEHFLRYGISAVGMEKCCVCLCHWVFLRCGFDCNLNMAGTQTGTNSGFRLEEFISNLRQAECNWLDFSLLRKLWKWNAFGPFTK